MANLILIDSRVPGISDITSSLTPDTECIIFDYAIDTFESIQMRIQKPYTSVVIAQHNYGLPWFNLVMGTAPVRVKDIETIDPELESWSEFIAFLQWLKENGAHCVDFLACDLWANKDWVYAINKLRSMLRLTIRASIDITGADGNFVLESDNVDTIGIYFTSEILKYKYNFYTNSTPYGNGPATYTPLVFTAANPGYISATAYNSILGTAAATFAGANQSIPLTQDISNVAMVCMSDAAVAVLKTNGTVVAYGVKAYGGDTSPVASQLYNITKRK